jgi:transcriptional regulator with XRE-family HTH domain
MDILSLYPNKDVVNSWLSNSGYYGKMGFNEFLKGELEYKGMLVKELARATGIPKQTLDKYLLSNGNMPSADKAVAIAQALGVSVEYLVTGKNGKPEKTAKSLSPETRAIADQIEPLPREERKIVETAVSELVSLIRRPADPAPIAFSPLQKVFLRIFRV